MDFIEKCKEKEIGISRYVNPWDILNLSKKKIFGIVSGSNTLKNAICLVGK
jgi:hypothetical protein